MKGIAACGALLLLAGCQTPVYVAPAGDTATLIIDNPNDGVQLWAWSYVVASDCRERRMLTSPEPIARNKSSSPIPIAAGQEFSITLFAAGYGEECSLTGTFVPARGATYRAAYRWGVRTCTIRLLDVGTSAAAPMVHKESLKPMGPAGAYCGPRPK